MTPEEHKTLTKIRTKLLLGIKKQDLIYIKMQINNIDTLLYKNAIIQKNKS